VARALTSPDFAADLGAELVANRSGKSTIHALLLALKPLANLRGPMPLSAVTMFLIVALDEGKGVNTYARAIGKHRSVASRALHDIGGRARNGGPGLGLVSVDPHPIDPRRSQVHLTAKGRSIVREIFKQVRSAAARDC